MPKVLDPHKPVQTIAFREAIHFSTPMLVQAASDIACDPNVQGRAVFIGEHVHPVVVVTYTNKKNPRCFASLNMTNVAI